ncbi:MAG: nucleotidyltransferase domain-containing protein [Sulfurimonas sp.]|nr:nucleotidyltransferase domain-containing protein [Sulfurimonas sp.]
MASFALFGSFAKDTQTVYSDIDIAISKKNDYLSDNSSLKTVFSYRYFFTLWATFTAFLKLILDNPLQTRIVAKFYKGFIHSFFLLRQKNLHVGVSKFFNTIVEIIYEMHKKYDLPLVLGGGVFQNRVLLRLIMRKIPDVVLPEMFVSNDGAIAYGQAIAAASEFKTF